MYRAQELDEQLIRAVKRTSYMRQGFYVVVLLVALAGQVSGAVEALHIPLVAAVPAVGALELGGIVVLANADVRRRLGERAVASRLLSATIAACAVAFNWLAHRDHLLGGFFAGMSALGYFVWLMHTENQRRDRLRAKGDLPPTTPAYEIVGHWLRHPWLTRRAQALAKANPDLGLYESVAAARAQVRQERRQAAISKVLHRKIRSAVDPRTADIAIAVYDLDEIATRLADRADYDGLTSLIAADLAPARLAPDSIAIAPPPPLPPAQPQPSIVDAPPVPPAIEAAPPPTPAPSTVDSETRTVLREDTGSTPLLPPSIRRELQDRLARGRASTPPSTAPPANGSEPEPPPPARTIPAQAAPGDKPRRREPERNVHNGQSSRPVTAPGRGLRGRVHQVLNEHVSAGDEHDDSSLVDLVTTKLNLTDADRTPVGTYVQSWRQDVTRR